MFISSLTIATRPALANRPDVTEHATHRVLCRCPKCGGDLLRVRRFAVDRLLSLFVPVRRFRCVECVWEGLVTRNHWKPAASACPRGTPALEAHPVARRGDRA